MKEVRRRSIAWFECVLVKAVQAASLKNRKIDAGAKVVSGTSHDNGSHIGVCGQGLPCLDQRFEHGKVHGIVFFRPVEGKLCNVIFDFYRNSVTHSQLPLRLSLSGRQCISRVCVFVLAVSILCSGSLAVAPEYPAPGVFDVFKTGSEIRVLIYPAGLLKGFGHSHVISTDDIEGRIEIGEELPGSGVELTIPVESFEVDLEALREEEGGPFENEVPESAKRGTRKNMLGAKLLDSAKFSTITVRSTAWSGELPDILVTAEFAVRDQTNVLEFPASVDITSNEIVVTGGFTVTHEQLGLKPFTAGLGSLRVRDEMELKFRILAVRVNH